MISVSTHVLDVERGVPAEGVSVALVHAGRPIATAATGTDGRIAHLAESLAAGTYQLRFDVASYFAAQGRPAPFLHGVSLDLAMLEDRHYHVPLLISAYACTTYRGS